MAGSGRRVFAPGEVLSASNVMNYLQDQAVMNFAGTAARGSAIGTAVAEGMVSYLADSNAVEVYDGSAWKQVYPSVANTGEIVQVVSAFKSDTSSVSSTTFTDVSGLSVTITPKSATNKFFIMVDGITGFSTANNATRVNLVRNSTNIAQGTGATYNQTRENYPASASLWWPLAFNYLDSPATSSAITYKVQIAADGSGTAYWGRRGAAADYSSSSSITVFEVVA